MDIETEKKVSARYLYETTDGFPIKILDQLKEKNSPNRLLVRPERIGYFPGEKLSVEVYALDGRCLGVERFRVGKSAGSGFAGQVYWALPEGRVRFDGEVGGDIRPVAIKVLKPKSRGKRIFRDFLFQLSYQTSYAPRLREAALRSGLIWQALLRIAAGIEFGAASVVARPLGYYWDAAIGSFAEIHEWVDGRTTCYEADDRLLLRHLRRGLGSPRSEMGRKKQFMDALAWLCREIGATGLARQYEWYTFVSQANVLARRAPVEGLPEFTAVDCRPGLAVPFFLPLSPVHARIILTGLKRGDLVHFDEVDFGKLDGFVRTHASAFESVEGLIRRLKEDDGRYRAGLPGLWQAGKRGFFQRTRWQAVKAAAIDDRLRLGHISEDWAGRLRSTSAGSALFLLLDRLPLIGLPLLRLKYDEFYRVHVRLALSDPAYFKEVFEARRATDLLTWFDSGRISADRCDRLAGSTYVYLFDKLLSWLPGGIHRLMTDAGVRACLARAWFVRPVTLMLSRGEREKWLLEVLDEQVEKGLIGSDQFSRLNLQVREPRLQGFIRDLGFTAGLEVLAKFLYLGLAAYGIATRNFLPFSLAALSPIPPSGVARAGYVLAQLLGDLPHILRDRDGKLLLTRWVGLTAAPWRGFGNLFAMLEMFSYYSELSLLLGNEFVSRMVAAVPVLGGPGKLLEYWAFQVAYNFPLSLKRAIVEMPSWLGFPTGNKIVERSRRG